MEAAPSAALISPKAMRVPALAVSAYKAILRGARLTSLRIVTEAKVIFVLMHHHRATDDRGLAKQLDKVVCHLTLGITIFINRDVAQITNMAVLISGSTMVLPKGI